MKSNIVAILLTFSLCPISIMGQGFSNFVGNKDRILTTDTVCNGRNKLVVDEVLTPVEEGRYKHTMRIFINDKNGIREKCKVYNSRKTTTYSRWDSVMENSYDVKTLCKAIQEDKGLYYYSLKRLWYELTLKNVDKRFMKRAIKDSLKFALKFIPAPPTKDKDVIWYARVVSPPNYYSRFMDGEKFSDCEDRLRTVLQSTPKIISPKEVKKLQKAGIDVLFLFTRIDERGDIIHWWIDSDKPLHGVISKRTLRKIDKIMNDTKFPPSPGLGNVYRESKRLLLPFPGSERKKETIERMVGFQDRREELRWLRNHD